MTDELMAEYEQVYEAWQDASREAAEAYAESAQWAEPDPSKRTPEKYRGYVEARERFHLARLRRDNLRRRLMELRDVAEVLAAV